MKIQAANKHCIGGVAMHQQDFLSFFNSSSFKCFGPLIATSLALALGASGANAQETTPKTNQDCTLSGICYKTQGDFTKVTSVELNDSGNFKEIKFTDSQTTLSNSSSDVTLKLTGTGSATAPTVDKNNHTITLEGANSAFKIKTEDSRGLQMQSDGTGTLTFDFGASGATQGILDLGATTENVSQSIVTMSLSMILQLINPHSQDPIKDLISLKGNLTLKGDSNSSKFEGTLKGGVSGLITAETRSGHTNTLTFGAKTNTEETSNHKTIKLGGIYLKNGASLKATLTSNTNEISGIYMHSIGKTSNQALSEGTMTLNGEANKITTHSKIPDFPSSKLPKDAKDSTDRNTQAAILGYVGGGNKGVLNILLQGKNGKNDSFATINTIEGNIEPRGKMTVNLTLKGETNQIKGNVDSTSDIGNYTGARNTIAFHGKTNTITGDIKTNWYGGNQIVFNTKENGSGKNTTDSTNTIEGQIFNGGTATNTIIFNGGKTNSIKKASSVSSQPLTQQSQNSAHIAISTRNLGDNLIVFNGGENNTIDGDIYSIERFDRWDSSNRASNIVIFKQNGASNQTNTITGNIQAGDPTSSSEKDPNAGGYNKIVFESTSSTHKIQGGIVAKSLSNSRATNEVTFNGGKNNTIGETGITITYKDNNNNKSQGPHSLYSESNGTNILNLTGEGTQVTLKKKVTDYWDSKKTEFNLEGKNNQLTIEGGIEIWGGGNTSIQGMIFNFDGESGMLDLKNGNTPTSYGSGSSSNSGSGSIIVGKDNGGGARNAKLTLNFNRDNTTIKGNIQTESDQNGNDKNTTTLNLNETSAKIEGKIENTQGTAKQKQGNNAQTIFNFNALATQGSSNTSTPTLTVTGGIENKTGEMTFNIGNGTAPVYATLIGTLKTEASGITNITFKSRDSSFVIKETNGNAGAEQAGANQEKETDIKHTHGALNINFQSSNGIFKNKLTAESTSQVNGGTSSGNPIVKVTLGKNTGGVFEKEIQIKNENNNGNTQINLEFADHSQATLTLQGDKNTITTLRTSSQSTPSTSVSQALTDSTGNHGVINLASGSDSTPHTNHKHNFRVLEIGNKTQIGTSSQTRTGDPTGLASSGFTFKIFVDAQADQTSSNKTKIGGVESKADGDYGFGYSDRLIVHHGSNHQAPVNENLVIVIDPSQLSSIAHTKGQGTEKEGNIAVATVVNQTDTQEALVTFNLQTIENGGEVIVYQLSTEQTNEKGMVNASGSSTTVTASSGNDKKYTTYFLDKVARLGANTATQKQVSSALTVNYDLYVANFNSLNKRLGELRENPKDQGIWARVFGGVQESTFGVGNKMQYITVQGGYDYALNLTGAKNYVGFAIAYARSSGDSKSFQAGSSGAVVVDGQNVVALSDIQSSGYEFGVYNSYVSNRGWYNDTIAKVSYITSDFKLSNSTVSSQTSNVAFTLSNEVGYYLLFGKDQSYFIDPQVELGLGYIHQSDFIAKLKSASGINHLNASQNRILMLRSRAGASIGKKLIENNRSASLYLGVFYEYDYVVGGNNTIVLGNHSSSSTLAPSLKSNGRAVFNIGSNLLLNTNARLYVDVEKSFGDKLKHLQFNLGARYSF